MELIKKTETYTNVTLDDFAEFEMKKRQVLEDNFVIERINWKTDHGEDSILVVDYVKLYHDE
ncbi:MAG TPA: hypothetical protein VLY84_00245 [Dysgonamonadaceae bacterium]|nr:hypothetical protein [Dysgonamonadaceae bacterium]